MTLDQDNIATMPEWVAQIRARGWQGTLLTLLDMFEPIAPIIAQGFFIGQPLAERWGASWHKDAWQNIAQALESPSARDVLRQQLEREMLNHDTSGGIEEDVA